MNVRVHYCVLTDKIIFSEKSISLKHIYLCAPGKFTFYFFIFYMKKAIATFLISATALGGSLAYAHAQENTTSGTTLPAADQSIRQNFKKFGDHKPAMMLENVQETRTNLENGVKITRTSTDAEVVAKLQAEEANRPTPKNGDDSMSKITFSKATIDNGVEITMTSSDADMVKQLQEGPKRRDRHDMFALDNVVMNRENISNGIKITQTSTDAEVVSKLQSSEFPIQGKDREDTDVQTTKSNIDNGVEITLTSTNPETVTKLQEGPKNKGAFMHRDKKAPSK